MSGREEKVTPTIEFPPMRLPPRLFKDEVCLQAVQEESNVGVPKLTCTLLGFRGRVQLV